jgi:hypothetical protein
MPPSPLSPYAATKVACEQYVRAYAQCYSLDTVSLRYFNVFGPRQDPSSPYSGVIARFCLAFCQGDPLTIYGDGEQSRDFTFVTNVVQANLLAARHPQPLRGDVLNIGAGQRTTLNDLLALFNQVTGQQRQAEYQPGRSSDVRDSLADIDKARTVLGYQPAVSLHQGLAQTLEWYRDALSRPPESNGHDGGQPGPSLPGTARETEPSDRPGSHRHKHHGKSSHSGVTACPVCGSSHIHHSRKRGLERALGLFLRSYRCHKCNARFHRFHNKTRKYISIFFWLLGFLVFATLAWQCVEMSAKSRSFGEPASVHFPPLSDETREMT